MLAETVNSRAFILLNFEHPKWGAVCAECLLCLTQGGYHGTMLYESSGGAGPVQAHCGRVLLLLQPTMKGGTNGAQAD